MLIILLYLTPSPHFRHLDFLSDERVCKNDEKPLPRFTAHLIVVFTRSAHCRVRCIKYPTPFFIPKKYIRYFLIASGCIALNNKTLCIMYINIAS